MRSPRALFAAVALCLGLFVLPGRAQAEIRFAVRPFQGPNAGRVHTAVVQACQSAQRVEVIDNARLEGAAAALHVDLDTDEGRAAVARELHIAAFMDGRVQRRGKQLVFVLETYRGAGGEKIGEGSVRARSAPKLAALARQRLATTLRKLRDVPEPDPDPPSDAEQADEPEPADLTITQEELDAEEAAETAQAPAPDAEIEPADRAPAAATPDEAEPDADRVERPAFELGASFAAITRDFGYRDAQSDLPEHDVSPAPMVRLGLRWYPAAHFGGEGIAANIGLDAHGELMMPVTANDGASEYETAHREIDVGARLRAPIGRSELGLVAGLGMNDVHIGDSQFGGDPEVPSVAYRSARLGADARIAIGSELQLGLSAAYLHPFGYGEIADARWFPRVSGGGVDAEISTGYVVSRELVVQVALGVTRYFMAFHPDPGDRSVVVMRRIAGGAADQQLQLGIGAALRL